MSEDQKPRITSFAYSREFFNNDNSLSTFFLENNFELYNSKYF